MTTLVLDLWHDLREKRLWPVAVGLLAATAAIPLVLFKPASGEKPVPAAPFPAAATPLATLPAVNVTSAPVEGSRLDTFHQKNPFRPMSDLKKATATSPSGAPATSGNPSAPAKASGTGPSAGTSAPSSSAAPSSGGSTPPSSGGSTPPAQTAPTLHWFKYTADAKFGEPGHMKTHKGMDALTLLPDKATAAIVFMGVTTDGKSAEFFIADPAFQAQGEGKCNAKGSACRFVTLTLSDKSNEEAFVSLDGKTEYDVKLTKISRVNLSPDQVNPAKAPAKKVTADGKGVTASGDGALGGDLVPTLLGLPGFAATRG